MDKILGLLNSPCAFAAVPTGMVCGALVVTWWLRRRGPLPEETPWQLVASYGGGMLLGGALLGFLVFLVLVFLGTAGPGAPAAQLATPTATPTSVPPTSTLTPTPTPSQALPIETPTATPTRSYVITHGGAFTVEATFTEGKGDCGYPEQWTDTFNFYITPTNHIATFKIHQPSTGDQLTGTINRVDGSFELMSKWEWWGGTMYPDWSVVASYVYTDTYDCPTWYQVSARPK